MIVQGRVHTAYDNTIRDAWVTLEEVKASLLAQTGITEAAESQLMTHPDTHELLRSIVAVTYDNGAINATQVKAAVEGITGVSRQGLPSDSLPIPNPMRLFDLRASAPDGIVVGSWPAVDTPVPATIICFATGSLVSDPAQATILGFLTKTTAAETYEDASANNFLTAPDNGTILDLFLPLQAADYVMPANSITLHDDTAGAPVVLSHGILTMPSTAISNDGKIRFWVTSDKELFVNRLGFGVATSPFTESKASWQIPKGYEEAVADPTRKL